MNHYTKGQKDRERERQWWNLLLVSRCLHVQSSFLSYPHPFPSLGWPISLIFTLSVDSKLATCLKNVEIKCQLDETEVFIADLIACSTRFGHHYAHHQELKSIIQWLLPVVFCAVVFKLLVWCGAEGCLLVNQQASCKPSAPHQTSNLKTTARNTTDACW